MQTSAKETCFQFAECSLSYAKIGDMAPRRTISRKI